MLWLGIELKSSQKGSIKKAKFTTTPKGLYMSITLIEYLKRRVHVPDMAPEPGNYTTYYCHNLIVWTIQISRHWGLSVCTVQINQGCLCPVRLKLARNWH